MKPGEPTSKKQWAVQRRFARLRIDLNVTVHYRERTEQSTKYAHGTDMSLGGLSIYLPADLAPDTEMELEFKLPPENQSVRLKARVRNKNMYRYGLEWFGLTDVQRHDLREACEYLEKQKPA